jgi:hydroxypyruvate isomerase
MATRLSVCIETFWEGTPEDQKIRRIAELGFKAFEFWGWKGKNLEAIRTAGKYYGIFFV